MGSYTTNFLWNHPYSQEQLGLGMDLSGGMLNTPDTPETLNFTKNQLPTDKRYVDAGNVMNDANVLQPDFSQVNKASMIPDGFIDKMKSLWGGITNTDAAQAMNINYPGGNPYYGQRSPQTGFEEMDLSEMVTEPQKKGFNFSGIPSMFLNALNFRNPLSERSSNYNPALAGQIEDLRNVDFGGGKTGSWLGTQSSPYQIAGGPLAGKNLVSMFGTNDYDEMLADKAGWFQKRKDDDKAFSQKNWDAILAEIAARDAEKKIKTSTPTRTTGQRDTSGWGRADQGYTTRGGFTGKADPTSGGVRGHHGAAQGGYMRSRYNRGGRVGILAAF